MAKFVRLPNGEYINPDHVSQLWIVSFMGSGEREIHALIQGEERILDSFYAKLAIHAEERYVAFANALNQEAK